jgi:CBS domain-containing protein
MINLGVAIFNLIPGFPLDGGRLLRAALWKYFNDIKKATLIATNCGKGFAYILMGFGLLNIFAASFLSGVWFIFIGLFLLEAAEVSYQQTAMKNILSGILTKEIMTKDVVAVDAELHLNDLVDKYFFRYRFTSFPVISSDALVGLITLHNVKDVPRERWGETLTKEAMVPLSSLILIGPDVEVMEALSKMAANGIGRLIVVQDHKILGFLSQRDVMRLFEVRLDLKT